MSDTTITSPLSGRGKIAPRGRGAPGLEEVTGRGMIDLRLDPDDMAGRAAAETTLGFMLPGNPRTTTKARARIAHWWSTDQWLVTCTRGQVEALTGKLEDALVGYHAMVTNVSDARTIIRVTGTGARETVMKGTDADLLDPRVEEGHIRRTQIAEVPVAVYIVSLKPVTLDIFVFRSYAGYLWSWLERASRKGAEVHLFTPQDPPRV